MKGVKRAKQGMKRPLTGVKPGRRLSLTAQRSHGETVRGSQIVQHIEKDY